MTTTSPTNVYILEQVLRMYICFFITSNELQLSIRFPSDNNIKEPLVEVLDSEKLVSASIIFNFVVGLLTVY